MKLETFDLNYFLGKSHFILKVMTPKIIWCFSHVKDIIKRLVIANFFRKNQKDRLMKVLNLPLHLITVFVQS